MMYVLINDHIYGGLNSENATLKRLQLRYIHLPTRWLVINESTNKDLAEHHANMDESGILTSLEISTLKQLILK